MSVALYMDHNVPRAITVGLRLRGVDVITAFEDDASTLRTSKAYGVKAYGEAYGVKLLDRMD